MAFKCGAELTSQSAHFKTHRGFLKSPFRSFVLTGDRRYTMSVFSAVLLNLRWRGPWSIRSAELVPVGAGTGMKSMVFKWTSPTLQQARRFLETTLVIPPVVRTDDWDNVWRCFSSHLFLFDARLSCEAVWAWRYTRPPTFTSQRGHAANPPRGPAQLAATRMNSTSQNQTREVIHALLHDPARMVWHFTHPHPQFS